MNLIKIIEKRKSTRNFKEKKVSMAEIDILIDYFNKSKKLTDEKTDILFIKDGMEANKKLGGIAGYNGVMISAPHYFLLISEETNKHIENIGYIGEQLVLKATEMGVSTCWLTLPIRGKIISNVLGISTNKEVVSMIAIGYSGDEYKVINKIKTGENYSKSHLKIIDDNTSWRLSVEEIVFLNEWGNNITIDFLEKRALLEVFHYTRLAPSSFNRQPWRFIIDEDIIILAVREDDEVNFELTKIDGGIIMLHFELMMKERGISGGWKLYEPEKKYSIPEDYYILGHYSKD